MSKDIDEDNNYIKKDKSNSSKSDDGKAKSEPPVLTRT